MKLFLALILVFSVLTPLAAEETKNEPYVYQDHKRRDPFWPLLNSSGNIINYDSDLSVNDMVLEGIMFGANGDAIAIVNGKVVKKGDKLGDFVVESLEKDSVIVSKGEEKFELRLRKKED